MTSNPASELLDIFDRWDEAAQGSAFKNRGEADNRASSKLWAEQARASALMHQLVDYIELTADSKRWRKFINDAWGFIYLPRYDWTEMNSGIQTTPDTVRVGLLGLSGMIGPQGLAVEELTASQITTLRETLEQIEEQLGLVPQKHRKYVDDILFKVRDCLRLIDGELSPRDLREARERSFEIVGESLYAVMLVPEESKKSFFRNLMRIAGTWVGGVITGASGEMLSTALQQVFELSE